MYFFLKEIYCTENSARYTRLQNCSFNQFAIVVVRRARDRVSTVLGMYKCSSEKQVQREKHCCSQRMYVLNVYICTFIIFSHRLQGIHREDQMCIQGVSGGMINILGGGSMDYSE